MERLIKPVLPPKEGYVEKVNTYNEHYYKQTRQTIQKLKKEREQVEIQNDVDSLLMDYEYRLIVLELGLE